MTKDSFGIRLQRALDSRDCKAIELHRKTGISRGAISSYLSGRWKAKQDKVYLIAKALNVSPAWLMGYDVPMDWDDEEPLPDDAFRPELKSVPMLGYSAAGEPLENMEGQDTYFVQVEGYCESIL